MRGLWCFFCLLMGCSLGFAELAQTATAHVGMPDHFPRPLKVGVIFLLNEVEKINESDSSYIANFDLTLTWKDSTQAFDPNQYGTFQRELSLDQVTKFLSKVWNPAITIANMKGPPLTREPCLFVTSDGTITYIQRIKAILTTDYNLKPFPFDTQHLLVKLTSNQYNDSEIEFYQDQQDIYKSGIREGFSFPGWKIGSLSFSSYNTRGLDGKFFPVFNIEVKITRKAFSYLFTFAPLLLIVIIPTIVTLYAQVGIGDRLASWAGAILALIALSFTLQLRYPALPANGIVNQLVAVIFAYEFIMICLSMTILNPDLNKRIKNPYLIGEMVDFMRWQVPFVFLAIVALIVLITLANA